MLERGKSFRAVCAIFMLLIVLDLAGFVVISLPAFTLPRENIYFNEKRSGIIMPEKRTDKLYIKDQFRYFKPALYEKFTAFDSGMVVHFDKEYIKADLEEISKEIKDGIFPLQDLAVSLKPEDLLREGLYSFESWDSEKKRAYLAVMEIITEEFALKNNFYFSFPNIKDLVFFIRRGIDLGYSAVEKSEEWEEKGRVVMAFLNVLRLRTQMLETIENDKFAFYGEASRGIPAEQIPGIHEYIFYRPSFDVPTSDFLISLSDLYRIDDPTFVRFKEYDRMVKLYDPENFYDNLPSVRRKLKKDLAISAPIFRFYGSAEYVDDDRYWPLLESGQLDENTLYTDDIGLFAGWGPFRKNYPGNGGYDPDFSYSVDEHGPNRVKVTFSAESEGYLYFSDGYDKYWKVSVDGHKSPLIKANKLFKAVKIPAGASEAVFEYDPVYFRISMWIYYIVSVLCLTFLAMGRGRYAPYREDPHRAAGPW